MENNTLVEIKNLDVNFRINDDYYKAVDNVNLKLKKNIVFHKFWIFLWKMDMKIRI